MKQTEKQRSGFRVMAGLIGMIKPLIGAMISAVTMGTAGNLCAIFIPVLGTYGVLDGLSAADGTQLQTVVGMKLTFPLICVLMVAAAIARAVLKYAEQACNHYIAFKLLARIRDKIFASLRTLTPAKLEGKERGNLISLITSDVELLEVFYAHTISPIAIAVFTSAVMIAYIGHGSWLLGVTAFGFYLLLGLVVPLVNARLGEERGQSYRELFGKLNTIVLDNLRGISEILQYGQEISRKKKMLEQTGHLNHTNKKLKNQESTQGAITNAVILAGGGVMLLAACSLAASGEISFSDALLKTVAMMSSFGPTAALSSLSNNLHQTLASGNRVLNLMEEQPLVNEIENGAAFENGSLKADHVSFAYPQNQRELVLHQYSAVFERGKITGVLGKSGCGKSTLLKLFMRFFEADDGSLTYHGISVNKITTGDLRRHISYVTQETYLFHDTIQNNIRIAREGASLEEVMDACKKASIHEFIRKLPNGYETKLSELGDSLSGGERQRIGIARAFLHDGDILFLDEPTSNLDSLNEAVILKSLSDERGDKTTILVSHRKSTMGITDKVIQMKENKG